MRLAEQARTVAHALERQPRDARTKIVAAADVDAVAAAAILLEAVRRTGRTFHVSYQRADAPTTWGALADDPSDVILLIGILPTSLPTTMPPNPLVIELARPRTDPAPPSTKTVRLQPDEAEEGTDPSLAVTAFALAHELAPGPPTAILALLGAFARGARPPWPAPLRLVVDQARDAIDLKVGPAFEDATLGETFRALPDAWKPAAQDVSDPDAFLQAHGLPPSARLHELGRHDLEQWTSLLVVRGLRRGVDPTQVRDLLRAVPYSRRHLDLPFPRIVALAQAAIVAHEPALALFFLLGDTTLVPELERLETRPPTSPETPHA